MKALFRKRSCFNKLEDKYRRWIKIGDSINHNKIKKNIIFIIY